MARRPSASAVVRRDRGVRRGTALALGLLAGVAADHLIPDPRRGHPVAAFGAVAAGAERLLWRDDRVRGAAYTALLVGGAALFGRMVERVAGAAGGGGTEVLAVTVGTWAVLGSRSLRVEAETIGTQLLAGDIDAVRARLPHLVGRDPSDLGPDEIARAVVESVAENTADATVAPLLWGAVAGLPGLLAYRAANTLDAMVGHHSARYENFGWASAKLDDVLNLAPARLTALLTVAVAPVIGGRPVDALRIARRDGRRHPSPNAGWCEAAFAGALGLRLGGRNVYGSRVEERPSLGDGQPPAARDINRATRLSTTVTFAAAGVAAGLVAAAVAAMRAVVARDGRRS
ncbi:MAG: cobalamin biosynthesis protein [Actinobacteria bacterium]|nr:cobalamin biosynthesis protein [Actinomycetota bacterium]